MKSTAYVQVMDRPQIDTIQKHVETAIDELIGALPDPERLSAVEGHQVIARYAAVLEGNFIYWMTAALLSVKSEEARDKIVENLREEVRDCHPSMLRRFVIAARAVPTDTDALSIYPEISNVRLFLGRLQAVPILVTMAFFEGYIQRFMGYLASLAQRQGSSEMEYTDVHGVCDVTHTQELFNALNVEMTLDPPAPSMNIYEGVDLLSTLLSRIVEPALSREAL